MRAALRSNAVQWLVLQLTYVSKRVVSKGVRRCDVKVATQVDDTAF